MASQLKFSPKSRPQQTLSERIQPFLAEINKRSASTEAGRMVPKENIDSLREAGFFRAMVPAAWGGDERDLVDFCEGVRTVVRACPATGWVSGVLNVHPAGIPLFDVSVQKEVWATGPDTIISSSGSPVMKATLADGGIRVTGRGRWSSGCDHVEWAMVGVKVPNVADGQYPERNYSPYMFMAHRSEFEIDHESWNSNGMRGTGSKDLIFDNLFVPSRRMERLEAMSFGFSRGAGTVDSWIARTPFGLLFATFLPAVALGCADGMIDEFTKRQRVRKNNLTGAQGILNSAGYMRLAEARHEIDSLTAYYHDLLWKMQGYGQRGDRPNEATFQNMQAPFNFITDRAVKALSRLFEASGASAIADFNPMQRYWRDGHAARLHLGSDYDTAMQNHGRSLIGLPPTPDL
jgi:alkylation response protein AidB-like acyl-CoA dehydrogenase